MKGYYSNDPTLLSEKRGFMWEIEAKSLKTIAMPIMIIYTDNEEDEMSNMSHVAKTNQEEWRKKKHGSSHSKN